MPPRYEGLCLTLAGFQDSKQPFIGELDGHFIEPDSADDQGIFWLIPPLIRRFHLTLDGGIDLFFGGALLCSFMLGLVGFFALFHDPRSRLVAVAGLLALCAAAWATGDVYSFYCVGAVAVVPLFLWMRAGVHNFVTFLGSLLLAGGLAGMVDAVRSYAGIGAVIFMLVILAFGTRFSRKRRLALCLALLAGMAIPSMFYNHAFTRRSIFLTAQETAGGSLQHAHVFWHSAYIGLGYSRNPYVPAYQDEVGFAAARAVDPSVVVYSTEYESILREKFFRIARDHPLFFAENLAVKATVVLLIILACANVGLLAAWKYPSEWPVQAAFWLAMGFNSLFGILVVPKLNYLLGVVSFAVLYGIFSIGHAMEKGWLWRLRASSGDTCRVVAL
jgi:hypothetical protein